LGIAQTLIMIYTNSIRNTSLDKIANANTQQQQQQQHRLAYLL